MRFSTVFVMAFVTLTKAELTSEWHPAIFNVPYGQAISRLLVSTQAPSAAAYVAFFVNGEGWTFHKYFTIAGGRPWHLIDIVQPRNSATVVMGPVAGLNKELKKGRLAHVAVKSREPVQWVFCSYSCMIFDHGRALPPSPPAPCPTMTTTTPSGGNSLLLASTSNTSSVTVAGSSVASSSSSVASSSSSTNVTALGALCALLALTTITLTVYVCFFSANKTKDQNERLTNPSREVTSFTSSESRRSLRQEHYPGGEGLGASASQGTDNCQSKHGTSNEYSQYTEEGTSCINREAERGYLNLAIREGDDKITGNDYSLCGKEESSLNPGEGEGCIHQGTEGYVNHGTAATFSIKGSAHGSEESVYDIVFH